MDVLESEITKLLKDSNLRKSIKDVEIIIDQLEKARETIVAGRHQANTLGSELI